MRVIKFGVLLLLVCSAVSVIAGEGTASAQSPISFGVRPANGSPTDATRGAYFKYELTPGQTVSDQAQISTTSADPLPLTLYGADAVTASGGGTAFAENGQIVSGDGSWLSLLQSEVSVTQNTPVTVAFSVAVPADATPGDHVLGLVVQAAPKAGPSQGGVQTTVTERAGVAIVIRVPGQLNERLTLGSSCMNMAGGSNYFQIPVFNEGNVLTSGSGTFRLQTSSGEHVFERSVQLETVMPAGATVLRVFPPEAIRPGAYRASMEIKPQGGGAPATLLNELVVPKNPTNNCEYDIDPGGKPGDNDASTRDNFGAGGADGGLSGTTLAIVGSLGIVALLLAGLLGGLLLIKKRDGRPGAA